jgi:hypothetical protein
VRLSQAVTHALTAVLPAPDTTELVRACLHEGASSPEWSVWRRRSGDLRVVLSEQEGLRALMPLLYHARHQDQTELEPRDLTLLRAAALREELRYRTILPVAARALDALSQAGVEAMVTRGVALLETAYPAPGLRHCHDLDLLVRAEHLAPARATLASIGWTPSPPQRSRQLEGASVKLVHPTGFPLKLHTRLFAQPYYNLPPDGVFARGQSFTVGGAAARRTSSTDMLLHICVNAVCQARPTAVKWVADAWFTLREQPPIDWPLLTELAREGRLAQPLGASLTYLARELAAPIPPAALADLATISAREGALALDGALAAAQSARRASLPRATNHLTALRLAARVVVPSPAYMRATGPARSSAGLSVAYAMRLLRAVRQVGRLLSPS